MTRARVYQHFAFFLIHENKFRIISRSMCLYVCGAFCVCVWLVHFVYVYVCLCVFGAFSVCVCVCVWRILCMCVCLVHSVYVCVCLCVFGASCVKGVKKNVLIEQI